MSAVADRAVIPGIKPLSFCDRLRIAFVGIFKDNFRNGAAWSNVTLPASHKYGSLLRLNLQLTMLLLA
jgi:hypothetical protein